MSKQISLTSIGTANRRVTPRAAPLSLRRTTGTPSVPGRGSYRSAAHVEQLELAIAGAAVVSWEAPAVALTSPTAARIASALAMGPRTFADLVEAVRAEGSDAPISDLRRALVARLETPDLRAAARAVRMIDAAACSRIPVDLALDRLDCVRRRWAQLDLDLLDRLEAERVGGVLAEDDFARLGARRLELLAGAMGATAWGRPKDSMCIELGCGTRPSTAVEGEDE